MKNYFCTFVLETKIMILKKLSYEDFYEEFWDYVSSKIVDDHYFFEHESKMRAITKDIYDIYIIEEARIHPKYYARLAESLFFYLLKPDKVEKDHNKIDFDYDRIGFE